MKEDKDIPTIEVVKDTVHLIFKERCEFCRNKHIHGSADAKIGDVVHKGSHCIGNYPKGYFLKVVEE